MISRLRIESRNADHDFTTIQKSAQINRPVDLMRTVTSLESDFEPIPEFDVSRECFEIEGHQTLLLPVSAGWRFRRLVRSCLPSLYSSSSCSNSDVLFRLRLPAPILAFCSNSGALSFWDNDLGEKIFRCRLTTLRPKAGKASIAWRLPTLAATHRCQEVQIAQLADSGQMRHL